MDRVWLLLQLLYLAPIVAGEKYNLELVREKNDLHLTCHVINAYTANMKDMHFWINKTEHIDIVHGIEPEDAAFMISHNTAAFKLQPKYEGTFFCGENNGMFESAGLGPIAGTHYLVKEA